MWESLLQVFHAVVREDEIDESKFGVETQLVRDGFFSFWISAILNFGAVRTYHVIGKKCQAP